AFDLILVDELLPARHHELLQRVEVGFLALELRVLDVNAEDARRATADIRLAADDGRRPFKVDELARDGETPERDAFGDVQAVEGRAIGLVHAVAEDDALAEHGRRADGRQLQKRRRFAPEDTLAGAWVGREAGEVRGVEGAQARDDEVLADG